jgi:hypothetical protein
MRFNQQDLGTLSILLLQRVASRPVGWEYSRLSKVSHGFVQQLGDFRELAIPEPNGFRSIEPTNCTAGNFILRFHLNAVLSNRKRTSVF